MHSGSAAEPSSCGASGKPPGAAPSAPWDARREAGRPAPCLGLLSVVIPTLNEAGQLESTLQPVLAARNCEVLVADGGSTDGTIELARRQGCRVVASARGRGRQMNAGAAEARGEHLLFLHADTRLPATFREEIPQTLAGGAIAGAFRMRIDEPGWGLRCVAWGANLRSRLLQRPYGDQGLFLRARDFFELGGFRDWPVMEDFEFCSRVKRSGRIVMAPSAAATSARRWRRLGVVRSTWVNQMCIAMYVCGASIERIAAYRSSAGRRRPDSGDRPA